MNTLIIGGTSGLGLELARDFREAGSDVIVTGRREFTETGLRYEPFDLSGAELPQRVGEFVTGLPTINTLVYAAGYFQDGRITDLTEEQIEDMLTVGARGLAYFARALLQKQDTLEELITITSTSQWTPRQREPIYNLVKAAAGHLSNGLAEDGRIGRVMVAGPAGMATDFWTGTGRDDLSDMLDPAWVADQIMKLREDEAPYKYLFAQILRGPQRVEIAGKR